MIVVGNISMGGNGKTPVVQALVKLLRHKGLQPGILTRGYKSDYESQTTLLDQSRTSSKAGDEANMLSELCACPIAVGADRVQGANELVQEFPQVDVIIADDGLQHYSLQRDVEIIVTRKAANGNGFCLPAGPLREPLSRLNKCDLVIERDSQAVSEKFGVCWNLNNPQQTRELAEFSAQPVYAVAGIGFPQLFFDALKKHGLHVESKAFPDHHEFSKQDLEPFSARPILVTHKDAVKIRAFDLENVWVIPLELNLSNDLQYRLDKILESKLHG